MKPRFDDISRLCLSLLLHVLQAWQMMPKCLQKVTKGVPKLHIVDGNAQIEKLRFDCAGASGSRVRQAGKHVKANKNYTQTNTRRIHDFFVKSDTKDCQNGHRSSPHFTVISSVIFKHVKKEKSDWPRNLVEGTLDTSKVRVNWGASGTPGGHGASGCPWKQLLQYLPAKMQKFL